MKKRQNLLGDFLKTGTPWIQSLRALFVGITQGRHSNIC